MMRAQSLRSQAGCLSILLLVIVLAVLPGSAAADRAEGKLSPRLVKLATPALRDASAARQARAVGLTAERLERRGRDIVVNVRFAAGALAARGALQEAGAKIVAASGRYQTITVVAPPARLHAVAAVDGVASVTPALSPTLAATCPSGAIVSEGDTQLNAEAARDGPPKRDGSGVTVGILSDSFDQAGEVATDATEDVESGDLPGANECANKTPVGIVGEEDEKSEPSDEGRAMAQIVHDLAPGAQLKFATAFNSETSFANNIRALAAAGAKVIVDDVFWPAEPFFQDGPIAVAVNEVVEGGVTYFSAAGNDNLIDEEGHDIASWETPKFRDGGSCPSSVQAVPGANAFHCLDFNPGAGVDKTFGVEVEAGETLALDLQWDEPWFGVGTDLDAFLLNAAGGLIAESAEDNIDGEPVELLEWTNTSSATRTVQLAVNRFSGGDPRVKFALLQNGGGVSGTEYPRSSGEDVVGPTIFGHSGSANAISTGAVFFNDSTEPESYSSRGPVRHDFGPVNSAVPAAPLSSPEMLSKPDLVATDCGRTTFFSFFAEPKSFPAGWYFCGTSAAAPHAAAVAALMWQAKPTATPEEVRQALIASAVTPFEPQYGPCDVGAGLVDAAGAIKDLLNPTGGVAPTCEPPESEVEPEAATPGNSAVTVVPPDETTEPKRVRTPRTFFLQRPSKVIRTRHHQAKAVFRFGSNESETSFVCRVDGGFFRPCPARLARRFTLGWHVLKVAARDPAGKGDRTPASYSFKVKRVR